MADHKASGISMAFIKDGQVLFLSVFFDQKVSSAKISTCGSTHTEIIITRQM